METGWIFGLPNEPVNVGGDSIMTEIAFRLYRKRQYLTVTALHTHTHTHSAGNCQEWEVG